MTFLVLAPEGHRNVDPRQLSEAAGGLPVAWFSPTNPGLGGAVCLSPLATVARLRRGDRLDCVFIGRVRLDRKEELRAKLAGQQLGRTSHVSDADLCLQAYHRWGADFVEHIHGDFAFVIFDNVTRNLTCVRDRFGVRALVWLRNVDGLWAAGSMRDLALAPEFGASELDSIWIADFLRTGVCDDPARSVYVAVRRLPPAHVLTLEARSLTTRRYWTLGVNAPLHLRSAAAYEEAFHCQLNAAMRDRLPPDQLGILMSGGLDSSTLAAKAMQLSTAQLRVVARTWLVGGDADPEAGTSARVAEFIRLEQTFVDADRLAVDPCWPETPATTPEPSYEIFSPLERLADAQAMRTQAKTWFYGEGPDNALTFEWRTHLNWLARDRQWSLLPGVVASYLATKSLADWKTTIQSRLGRHRQRLKDVWPEPTWVRGAGSSTGDDPVPDWRPNAHRNLSCTLWPALFEQLDAEGDRVGIEWCHPYMDPRVLEFLLATPPIPWARHKLLIRRAMRGQLPELTLRRPKTPLYKEDIAERLRRHLPAMPQPGDAIKEFVDVARLPDDPSSYPDIFALTRVAILQHWLKTRNG